MNFFTGVIALVGLLANACLAAEGEAAASYSNGLATSILEPQEIGTMTSGGYLVYNVNVCSVVQQTICETSTSTGPSVVVSTSSIVATNPYNTPGLSTTPGAGSVPGQSASTVETGTSMSDAYTSTAAAATASESINPTSTYTTGASGTLTGSTPSVTTGAGSAVQVPALAMGLAGVVAGFLV